MARSPPDCSSFPLRRPVKLSAESPRLAISSCPSSSSPWGRRLISSALDPFQPASRFALITGGVLIVVGVIGKLAAGYAPFWFRGNKTIIGVAMVPRGEVGLIFAQMGLATGVFDAGLFGAVTLMVIVTTLLAPPCLKFLLGRAPDAVPQYDLEGIDNLVAEA